MTGGGSGEKTEKASPHKKSEARKKGNIFQSKDLISGAMILLSFLSLRLLSGYMFGKFAGVLNDSFNLAGIVDYFSVPVALKVMSDLVLNILFIGLPVLFISMILGFALSVAQTRFVFSTENAIKLKLSNLNPISGIKKMFSLKALVELIKSILKVSVISYIVYTVINSKLPQIPVLTETDIGSGAAWLSQAIFDVGLYAGIGMTIIGVVDYLYQWWEYERSLRMTKQEVKDEDKQLEGNPEIKGRIKSIQREMARKRMMSGVKNADVVIRNPKHFAVALKYDPVNNKDKAPVVIAKGKDYIALKIVEEAMKYDIYTVENPPLARALYDSAEIEREIPQKFWYALADIISHLYAVKKIDLKTSDLNKNRSGSNNTKTDEIDKIEEKENKNI